ncbi:Tetratricopeptide repeat protein 5 [Fasciola hepatica]|uniref:Tetratricopeptide repeat protein 5 n=1 Tax=Fasciola hepatica TaxID=6192 RepID=A0A4E0S009_FASHE|nr:Tetratricopeptide repeat protein 5 [Fasciola hepatica]
MSYTYCWTFSVFIPTPDDLVEHGALEQSHDSFTNALCSWLRAICLDPQWSAPRTCATRLIEFLSELNNSMDQIRRELSATEITRTDSVEPTSSDSRSSGCHKTTRVRRDSQLRIAEFITPLAPCLTLVASVGTGPSEQGEKMISSSTKSQALTRLLGPYAASGDSTRALLSGVPQTGRGKKGRGSGKRPPVYINPFQNTTNWQLTLFEDLQIGSNKDRVCVGRVLKELPSDTDLALNLLLVDARGTPLAARLYNIGKGLGPVRKDILAVPHPFVEEREVPGILMDAVLAAVKCADSASELRSIETLLDRSVEEISLRSNNADSGSKVIPDTTLSQSDSPKIVGNMCIRILRVPLPDVLVVNGHPVGFRWTAAPVLKNIFFTAI